MNKFRAYVHRQAFRSSQDLSVWLALTTRQQLMSHDCSKQQALSFAKMLVVWRIFSSDQCSQEYSLNKFRAYIHRHVFRPSQNSSVWLGLTSREQLMSPECSKHQVLSFAKMLVVNEQKIFCSHQCSPECSVNKFRAYTHRHVFRPSWDASLWLGLTSREQLISPQCSKNQMLSCAKILVIS